MMANVGDVGTLKELGVEVGDVVECVAWGYDDRGSVELYEGIEWTVHLGHPKGHTKDICAIYTSNRCGFTTIHEDMVFRLISRESDTPKLWRDMTPEEKGALLLAAHEGNVIEDNSDLGIWGKSYPIWEDTVSYRIKPEPKVESVSIAKYYDEVHGWHEITFNTIDGKPDCASVKMEAI